MHTSTEGSSSAVLSISSENPRRICPRQKALSLYFISVNLIKIIKITDNVVGNGFKDERGIKLSLNRINRSLFLFSILFVS